MSRSFNTIGIDPKKLPDESQRKGSVVIDYNIDAMSMGKQEAIRFAQDTFHRRILVIWMMCVVSLWIAVVLFVVISNKFLSFGISDNVLMVLLATTTVNVLGLAKIILQGLFGRNKQSFRKPRQP